MFDFHLFTSMHTQHCTVLDGISCALKLMDCATMSQSWVSQDFLLYFIYPICGTLHSDMSKHTAWPHVLCWLWFSSVVLYKIIIYNFADPTCTHMRVFYCSHTTVLPAFFPTSSFPLCSLQTFLFKGGMILLLWFPGPLPNRRTFSNIQTFSSDLGCLLKVNC